MAGEAPGRLLDCGHVGTYAGVCQYDMCANQICAECVATCETCGLVLCRTHQVWLDGRQRVFCPADTRGYLAKKLVFRLLSRK